MIIIPPARVTSNTNPALYSLPSDGTMKFGRMLINPTIGFHPLIIVDPTQIPKNNDKIVCLVNSARTTVMIGGTKHKIP